MSLNLLTDSQQAQPNYLNHGCAHINKAKKGFLCTKYKYNEQDCFPWDKRLCDSMISRGLCFDWVCRIYFVFTGMRKIEIMTIRHQKKKELMRMKEY